MLLVKPTKKKKRSRKSVRSLRKTFKKLIQTIGRSCCATTLSRIKRQRLKNLAKANEFVNR